MAKLKTVDALMEFLDWMAEEGLAPKSTMQSWKSATRGVLGIAAAEGLPPFDVSKSDLDAYITNFVAHAKPTYGADSVNVYKSRFRSAVEAFRAHQADPDWRPERTTSTGRIAPRRSTGQEFDLDNGERAELRLPARLTRADADRLKAFIDLLVRD